MDEDQQYTLDALLSRIPVSRPRPPSASPPTGDAPQRAPSRQPSTPSPGGALPRSPVEVEANAHGSVRVEAQPDRVTATASGSANADVNLRGPGGARGHVGAGVEGRVVADVRHEPGLMRYSLSGEVSGFVRADGSARGYGASFSGNERATARFEVAVPTNAPGNTDLRRVNPFDPSTMPVGTRVTMDAAQYSSREFNANLRYLSTRDRVNSESGVSVAVEATGSDRVRVTAGPREMIDAYHGVGLNIGSARAMLGRNDRYSGGGVHTAEFDLSNEAGRRAYGDFMAHGTLPRTNQPGVTDVSQVTRLDGRSQTQLDLGLGRWSHRMETDPNFASTVRTTHGDGSSDTRTTVQFGGRNGTLEIDRRADRNQVASDPTYSFRLTPNEQEAQQLNYIYGRNGETPFRAGQEGVLRFSPADLERMQAMVGGAGQPRPAALDGVAPDGVRQSPNEFAISLMRDRNNFGGLPNVLYSLATHPQGQMTRDNVGTTFNPLPGTVNPSAIAPAAGSPPLSSTQHPDHALYAAIRGRAPEGMSEDRLAQATLQARQADIRPDTLQSVNLQGNNLWVAGTIPGYRTNVDLAQPAPPAQETSARLHEQSTTQTQTQTQDAARQGRPESEREQPVHTRH